MKLIVNGIRFEVTVEDDQTVIRVMDKHVGTTEELVRATLRAEKLCRSLQEENSDARDN